MNLYELRKSIETDALVEKENLQKEIEALKKTLEEEQREKNETIERLRKDCEALANRCFVSSAIPTAQTMCYFCELNEYECPHAKSVDEKYHFKKHEMKKLFNSKED